MLDAVTLVVSACAAVTALALLWGYSGRRFPALVPVAVVGLLVLTVGLSPSRRMEHTPEVQPVAKAKAKPKAQAARVRHDFSKFPRPPAGLGPDALRLWISEYERTGAAPALSMPPEQASGAIPLPMLAGPNGEECGDCHWVGAPDGQGKALCFGNGMQFSEAIAAEMIAANEVATVQEAALKWKPWVVPITYGFLFCRNFKAAPP